MSTDKHKELLEKDGRIDLSHIQEGDRIKVIAREFIHTPTVFCGVEDELEEIFFYVRQKTHPGEGTDVNTCLWEASQNEANSNHLNLNDKRKLCDGTEIRWYVEKIEVV